MQLRVLCIISIFAAAFAILSKYHTGKHNQVIVPDYAAFIHAKRAEKCSNQYATLIWLPQKTCETKRCTTSKSIR